MRLVKLPANNAWVFLFGDKPVPMAPDNRTFFDTRAEAVRRAKLLGLAVSKTGELSAVHDEFTDKRVAKRNKRNPFHTSTLKQAGAGVLVHRDGRVVSIGDKLGKYYVAGWEYRGGNSSGRVYVATSKKALGDEFKWQGFFPHVFNLEIKPGLVTVKNPDPGKPAWLNDYKVVKKNPRRKRRANPGWYIHIQLAGHGHVGKGPVMLWNGKSFSNRPDAKAHPFASSAAAMYKARHLLGVHSKLSKYKIWVSDQHLGAPTVDTRVNPARRPNPDRDKLDEAAQKLEDFTGRPAEETISAAPRSTDKTGLVFGTLDLIGYQAKREGIDGGKMTRFVHKFRKSSRPLLAVSTDGKQLHVVGGQYEFTDAGIEDR